MIPEGTVVAWTIFGRSQRYGVVLGEVDKNTGRQLVRMDKGSYDPERWPDGLRYFDTKHLRVVK